MKMILERKKFVSDEAISIKAVTFKTESAVKSKTKQNSHNIFLLG